MINNAVLLFSATNEEIHCEQQKDLILLVTTPPPNPRLPAIFEYVIVGDLKIKVSAYFEGLSQAHYAMVICFQYAFLFFQEETSASGSGQSE